MGVEPWANAREDVVILFVHRERAHCHRPPLWYEMHFSFLRISRLVDPFARPDVELQRIEENGNGAVVDDSGAITRPKAMLSKNMVAMMQGSAGNPGSLGDERDPKVMQVQECSDLFTATVHELAPYFRSETRYPQ